MTPPRAVADEVETVDVLIVGAGLSGIGAACHLQRRCPERRVAIVEARDTLGGTWDLFRYPGVRSDSDMHTLGYAFRPWRRAQAIADGASILAYLRETADEAGITPRIRFGRRVEAAAWSTEQAAWTVTIVQVASGARSTIRARFVHLCSGYYSYTQAHRPTFDDEARYRGRVVQPQFWPQDLDCAGRRVVVVGSGATAVSLVPALARTAARVTMLQRSPSYIVALPSVDPLASVLFRCLPAGLADGLVRWKNLLLLGALYRVARRRPAWFGRRVIGLAARRLGPEVDVAAHFTPRYDPWDQRLCVAPDGDLFDAVRAGRVEMVTDRVERFTGDGLRLVSGRELPADVVVLATGLTLNVLGDIALTVDGRPIDPGRTLVYKGMMLGGVPNLALTFGYVNASWTLRADLTAAYVCRLLRHMARHRYTVACPHADAGAAARPFIGLSAGYVRRASAALPKQGTTSVWRAPRTFLSDLPAMRWRRLDDGVMAFSGRAEAP